MYSSRLYSKNNWLLSM